METTMTDRDPFRDDDPLQAWRGPASDPTTRASSQRALWSWIAGLAIVFVMFILFYGLNSQRESGTVTSSAPPAATTSPMTTGQGGSSQQNTSGSKNSDKQDQQAPAGEG